MKSLELLYNGESDVCKAKFKEYLIVKVVNRTEDTDNALKKYFKHILQRFSEEHSVEYGASNLNDIMSRLN